MAGKNRRNRGDWLVYSTQTNGTNFVEWQHNGADKMPTIVRSVHIAGGANLAPKSLVTPLGVMTEVTQDEMEFLNNNAQFLQASRLGFFTAVKASGWPDEPDYVAQNMTKKDGSAPKMPDDYLPERQPSAGADLPTGETTGNRRAKPAGAFR